MDKISFHTEQRKISDLIPYEHNPRKMTEEQNEQLKKSLEKFDLAEIPVINTDNMILAGHQRLRIMSILGRGEEVIDVRVPNRLLTLEECQEYNIRSNKNTGSFDFDVLANVFDTDMLLEVGFTELELGINFEDDSKPEDDDIPEIPVETHSKLGDLYEFGGHRVLCGSATEKNDVMKLMDGLQANMCFTDPPYNVDYTGKTKDELKIKNDKQSSENFYKFLFDFCKNAIEFTKGSFYICMSSSELHNLWKAFTDAGGHWQEYIIWAKNHFTLSRTDYHQQFEPIMYGLDSETQKLFDTGTESESLPIMYGWTKHEWYGGRKQGNVWHIDRPTVSREHPTMKPVALCGKAIINSSLKGDIVLDPFLGSGSTLIACEKCGRRCFGLELSEKYCDVIVTRWCRFTGNTKVVKNGKEINWVF